MQFKCGAISVEVNLDKQAENCLDVEEYNCMYTQGIVNHVKNMGGLKMLSCAPDKSRVHSFGLMVTPFATRDNFAWWGHPQELQKYGSEL